MNIKIAVLLFIVLAAARGDAQEEFVDWTRDETCQMVFHAVLEGLYKDGISNEVVDQIIPPGDKQFRMHFVYACPLCHPAFEAFKLYRARENFYGRKDDKDTFGTGLSPGTIAHLKSKDRGERLEAIQGLIETWVERRLASMRLTDEERGNWSDRLRLRMKMGFMAMEKADFDAKECAICRGSFEGSLKEPKVSATKPAAKPVTPPKAPLEEQKEF